MSSASARHKKLVAIRAISQQDFDDSAASVQRATDSRSVSRSSIGTAPQALVAASSDACIAKTAE